tara:strand:+ start:4495 stop:4938 length:444 start_codon:yes stop_codon:yes gene_type:complete
MIRLYFSNNVERLDYDSSEFFERQKDIVLSVINSGDSYLADLFISVPYNAYWGDMSNIPDFLLNDNYLTQEIRYYELEDYSEKKSVYIYNEFTFIRLSDAEYSDIVNDVEHLEYDEDERIEYMKFPYRKVYIEKNIFSQLRFTDFFF